MLIPIIKADIFSESWGWSNFMFGFRKNLSYTLY